MPMMDELSRIPEVFMDTTTRASHGGDDVDFYENSVGFG